MSSATEPRRDRRHLRHSATREEILDTAWEMARRDGLAGLSLRALAGVVGMQPQSLYTYFESKNAVYDAMFAQANAELAARQGKVGHEDPVANFIARTHAFVEFCTEDPIRYLLLFQRTIPGFTPSPESMALAAENLQIARNGLANLGVTDAESLDLLTAVISGLVAQQTANDPGGQRWKRLTDRAVAMFLREIGVTITSGSRKAGRSGQPERRHSS